jgi:hypothetical protein
MKITKSYLKQVIKEELQKLTENEVVQLRGEGGDPVYVTLITGDGGIVRAVDARGHDISDANLLQQLKHMRKIK